MRIIKSILLVFNLVHFLIISKVLRSMIYLFSLVSNMLLLLAEFFELRTTERRDEIKMRIFNSTHLTQSVVRHWLASLLVQLVQVSGKSKETNTENPCKDNRGSRSSSNAVHGLAQFRKDVVDHVASTRVLVSSPLDVLLALDGFFVRLLADLGNFLFLVSVVAIVVVCVSTENYNR